MVSCIYSVSEITFSNEHHAASLVLGPTTIADFTYFGITIAFWVKIMRLVGKMSIQFFPDPSCNDCFWMVPISKKNTVKVGVSELLLQLRTDFVGWQPEYDHSLNSYPDYNLGLLLLPLTVVAVAVATMLLFH